MIAFWGKIQERIFSKYALVLFVLYTIGIASIIRANRSYLDDVGRALYGYADWVAAARPLTELLAWFFYLGPRTVDASPLTQILAVAILAVTSLLLLDALRMKLSWPAVLCTIPVGLSPYGLENLSYKFDSPYMALALLFAVLPHCIMRLRKRGHILFAALCLFSSASLYQPALGAYLSIAVYGALTELASRRSFLRIAQRFFYLLTPFLLASVVYIFQVSFWFSRSQYADYVSQHSSLPPLEDLPFELWENMSQYVSIIVRDWSSNGLGLLIALLASMFIVNLVMRLASGMYKAKTPTKGILRLGCITILLPCLFFTPFGVQFVLSSPVWAPRTFHGFGVLVSLMMLSLYGFTKNRTARWVTKTIQGVLIIQLMIFANIYGNLLDAQNEWELSRVALLARDLNQYIKETGSSSFSFIGSVGLSPLAVNPTRKFPLLERLVTVPLTRDWRWGYEQLNTYGVQIQRRPLPENINEMSLTTFLESSSYKIQRTADDTGIVTFLPPPAPRPRKSRPAIPRASESRNVDGHTPQQRSIKN